ncbi:hypothetical protein BG006_006071 [Podila minutissima]|uniref:Uncharacterized protein n=1 Tax=Podila minutissima TaxID=64525 RepID=A0A9P5SNK6_9FUNG|nr:hypothetical protein BG006_006071 [Podila minutissima]
MRSLIEAFNKTKQAMVSDDIIMTKEELRQSWDEFELNHFDQIMDYTHCLSIYFEQLPRAETTFIALMIMSCHTLAIDKYLSVGAPLDKIDAKYFGMLSRCFSDVEMEYYHHLYNLWIPNCHEGRVLKQSMPSIPITRQFMWADWRNVNVGMSSLAKLVLMLNYPDEDLDIALVSSTLVYTSIQCGLLNDVGSVIKDKGSTEVNYYIEVAPEKSESQANIYKASIKHIAALDIPSNIKLVLKSALDGSYLLYGLSKRYFGKSEPNW